MFLMIGKKLGHYKITGKIGEVRIRAIYKAKDTKINRAAESLDASTIGMKGEYL
jgi:hypothetical protein